MIKRVHTTRRARHRIDVPFEAEGSSTPAVLEDPPIGVPHGACTRIRTESLFRTGKALYRWSYTGVAPSPRVELGNQSSEDQR